MPIGLLLAALLAPEPGHARSPCLTDDEIDRAVGQQVRSGAPFVDTSDLPDRPLCSGLTVTAQIQRIRAAAFPEERRAAEAAQQALIAREQAASPPPVAAPPDTEVRAKPTVVEPERRRAEVAVPKRKSARAHAAPAPRRASGASYPSCRAARAAGAAPIRSGEPGYSRRLDRDGDGIACE